MIESNKLFIKDVFEKWYRIAEYQRPYVWGSDQVHELLNDIFEASEKDQRSEYFLGSMVLQKKEIEQDKTKFDEYDILDGQQRLTTLFLLIATLRDLSENKLLKQTCSKLIFQEENPFNNTPERLRVIFDIRDEVKDFIEKHIKVEGCTLSINQQLINTYGSDIDISIKNMINNILIIKDFFQDNKKIEQFVGYTLNRVLMIYVATEDLDDAFKLFTIMNNRGVKLRSSDILKANNLSQIKDKDKRQKSAKIWEDAENYFGESFDEFLSHLRSILVKRKATVSLLKEYDENIYHPTEYDRSSKVTRKLPPLLEKGLKTFSFVQSYKQHYVQIFDEENYHLDNSYQFYNLLTLMKSGFESDFWIAPLLKYYDKFTNKDLIKFTKALDNAFAYDWMIGLTPTTRIENINAILEKIDNESDTNLIIQFLKEKIIKKEIQEELAKKIYGRKAARYLLLKLDYILHGNERKISFPPTISIEHILPQNPSLESQWLVDFNDSEARIECKDKLGNLVLLSRRKNSSQNNKDYAEKKKRYFLGNIELFSNSVRIFQQHNSWTYQDFEKNQKYVSELLLKYFTH